MNGQTDVDELNDDLLNEQQDNEDELTAEELELAAALDDEELAAANELAADDLDEDEDDEDEDDEDEPVDTTPLTEPGEIGREIARILSDRKAQDVVMLDIRQVSVIADYFVIATGNSERQIRALYREVDEGLSRRGVETRHTEGQRESGWVLLDYGDVIVHIFGPQERAYYRLERLWSNAPVVLSIQ